MPVQSKDKDSILYNHYLWCRREGRDTSWFFLYRVGMLDVNTKRRTSCASRIDPSDPSIACLVERRRSRIRA